MESLLNTLVGTANKLINLETFLNSRQTSCFSDNNCKSGNFFWDKNVFNFYKLLYDSFEKNTMKF